MLQEVTRHGVKLFAVLPEDGFTAAVGIGKHRFDFLVNLRRYGFGVHTPLCHSPPNEYFVMSGIKRHGANTVTHAVRGHHFAGNVGSALEVVAGPGGDVANAELFGDAPAEKGNYLVFHVAPGKKRAVFFGQGNRHAPGGAAWDDGNLTDGVLTGQGV